MQLSVRDEQLITTLTTKVRLLSLRQVADCWWNDTPTGLANARRRIIQLRKANLLKSATIPVKILDTLSDPLTRWSPGDEQPDFSSLAWHLKVRWEIPLRPTSIVVATPFAAAQFGGKAIGRLKKNLQASHDLGVSQVFVHLLKTDPNSARDWQGEDIFAFSRRNSALPDALLAANNREVYLAIEYGGAYGKKRLENWHRDCANRRLAYEIW